MDRAEATSAALATLTQLGPNAAWLASVGPILDRQKRQRSIEDAITELNPDTDEAAEILDALTASLSRRYEDHAEDAIRIADVFRKALAEVKPPAECIVAPREPK